MNSTNRPFIPAIAVAALVLGSAAPAGAADPHHTIVRADAVQWRPALPSLPSATQASVLAGSPGEAEPFILRLKLPAGMAHYAWVMGETVLQVNSSGPFDVIYVNPNDDPRKQ